MEEQKGINVQLAQRIDTVESTLNKRIDGLESNLNQKIDNLQYSITKIKVDKFYYPVDFVVLDTEPIASGPNHVPIILGRPFLAIANAIINCRNGVMQLTFGNMTLELNIFHLNHKHKPVEGDKEGSDEVCSIGQIVGKPKVHKLQVLANQDEAVVWELPSVVTVEQLLSPKSPSEKKINNEESNIKALAQATAEVKELLLLDPP